MPDHLPEPEQVERFTLQKRNGWWNVLDAPPTPTTIEARITTVPLSALQSQRQLTEEAEAKAERERERRIEMTRKAERGEISGWKGRAESAEAKLESCLRYKRDAEAIANEYGRKLTAAEHRAESLQRQVSEYREALEEARAEVRRLDQILESHEACAPLHRSKGPDG